SLFDHTLVALGPGQEAGHIDLRCPQCGNRIPDVEPAARAVTCPGCGGSFRIESRPGTVVRAADLPRAPGKFQLLELPVRGSFGAVYKAHDPELDRLVAIKVPRAGSFATAEEEERFLREARSAAQLVHPHIVRVHDIAHDGELPYIVSEYIAGRTLA